MAHADEIRASEIFAAHLAWLVEVTGATVTSKGINPHPDDRMRSCFVANFGPYASYNRATWLAYKINAYSKYGTSPHPEDRRAPHRTKVRVKITPVDVDGTTHHRVRVYFTGLNP